MSRRRLGVWLLIVTALAVVVAGGVSLTRSTVTAMTDGGATIPTRAVERGALELTVHMDGSLRASRQQGIQAPRVGSALRILSILDTGTAVREGDTILEFDPADQLFALEQAESSLREAEQNILKRQADIAAQEAQDRVALLTAEFDVRRAELDAAVDQDLIPANEYKIRQVMLEEARRSLEQTRQDVAARETTSRAGLAVLEEARLKAQLEADRARESMDDLIVRAPMDGVVSVRENRDAAGGVIFSGMVLPEYRVGDTANPGRPVIDVFDVSRMEIVASVNEQERANVSNGQVVTIESDVLVGDPISGKVTAVSGLGRAVRQAGPLRQFDVTIVLDQPDSRLRPGTSVRVIARGQQVEDALLLPRQAVFERDGAPVVFVRTADGFESREITVVHRTESRVAVEGIDEGVEVALVDPEASPGSSASTAPTDSAVAP
jgi:HlyD family secretion protein